MNVIQLSDESKRKSLAQAGKDLSLPDQFAATNNLQLTVALLSRHVDELRFRLALVEAQLRRRWYHSLMFWTAR